MRHLALLTHEINGKKYEYAQIRIPAHCPEAKFIDKAAADLGMSCNDWFKYIVRKMMDEQKK